MKGKLAFFYNQFIAREKSTKYKNLSDIDKKLQRKFIRINQLIKFRNDLAHGKADPSFCTFSNAQFYRTTAKYIVNELFRILEKNYPDLDRTKMPSS